MHNLKFKLIAIALIILAFICIAPNISNADYDWMSWESRMENNEGQIGDRIWMVYTTKESYQQYGAKVKTSDGIVTKNWDWMPSTRLFCVDLGDTLSNESTYEVAQIVKIVGNKAYNAWDNERTENTANGVLAYLLSEYEYTTSAREKRVRQIAIWRHISTWRTQVGAPYFGLSYLSRSYRSRTKSYSRTN